MEKLGHRGSVNEAHHLRSENQLLRERILASEK